MVPHSGHRSGVARRSYPQFTHNPSRSRRSRRRHERSRHSSSPIIATRAGTTDQNGTITTHDMRGVDWTVYAINGFLLLRTARFGGIGMKPSLSVGAKVIIN